MVEISDRNAAVFRLTGQAIGMLHPYEEYTRPDQGLNSLDVMRLFLWRVYVPMLLESRGSDFCEQSRSPQSGNMGSVRLYPTRHLVEKTPVADICRAQRDRSSLTPQRLRKVPRTDRQCRSVNPWRLVVTFRRLPSPHGLS